MTTTDPRGTYSLAVDYGDGFEAYLTWTCTADDAVFNYNRNRRDCAPNPTALIDSTGRILIEDRS